MDPKDEIKQKIDIFDLVSEYVVLKPSGSSGFKGLCPFHSEKSPSFHVSQDRQRWHCFGCNEGGDCFSFVMKIEGMNFPEALMHLGKKVGVEVRRLPTKSSNTRSRLLHIHELAQKFYRKILLESSQAIQARSYVESRHIPETIAETFGIGFAPDAWDTLSTFLLKRGFSEQELVESGLSMKRKKGTGVIDRFRNRLMIPLRDHHGNVVGFTGRILSNEAQGPKYMNSPETPIYSKKRIMFGLDLAKPAIREHESVLVVEGNLDVIASHKAFVKHVVASSGTALTEEQLILLKRYTSTIIFAFDADAAGFKAAKKGIGLARSLEFDVRAVILPPEVKDPDELIQTQPERWKELVEASEPIMQFLISHATQGKDLTNIDDKRLVGKDLLPALAQIVSVVEREHWLQVVADLLHIPVDQLRLSIQSSAQELSSSTQEPSKAASVRQKPEILSKEEKARRILFGYIITSTEIFDTFHERFKNLLNTQELWITLYNLALETYDLDSQTAQKSFFLRVQNLLIDHEKQESLESMLNASMFMAEEIINALPPQKVLEQIEHLFMLLEEEKKARTREALARQLRQAEMAEDKEAIARILKQLN